MKSLFIFTLILFTYSFTFGQAKANLGIGINLGGANYLGEIGGDSETRRDFIWDMKLNQTRWAMGAFARYHFSDLFAVNAGFMYSRIQGADSLSTNPGRAGRNLSFRNDIAEIYARGEIYIYETNDVGRRSRYNTSFQTYAYAGLAAFRHNPKAYSKIAESYVSLQPLATEGIKYKKFGFAIPIGVGAFFTHDQTHRFGFDIGWRLTFTDYLDDVSTVYVDPVSLSDPIAVEMANRTNELDPADIPEESNYSPGEKRGDPTHNDTYLCFTLSYSYTQHVHGTFYKQNYPFTFGRRKIIRRIKRPKF